MYTYTYFWIQNLYWILFYIIDLSYFFSLEIEISELEKSYHEQRKRQLEDIHSERLRQERENEIRLMDMQRALEHKVQKLVEEHQEKIDNKEQEFQVGL